MPLVAIALLFGIEKKIRLPQFAIRADWSRRRFFESDFDRIENIVAAMKSLRPLVRRIEQIARCRHRASAATFAHECMQSLWIKTQSSPFEAPYFSCVPYLLGEGQAMQYCVWPKSKKRTRIPRLSLRPPDDYLCNANCARPHPPNPCTKTIGHRFLINSP